MRQRLGRISVTTGTRSNGPELAALPGRLRREGDQQENSDSLPAALRPACVARGRGAHHGSREQDDERDHGANRRYGPLGCEARAACCKVDDQDEHVEHLAQLPSIAARLEHLEPLVVLGEIGVVTIDSSERGSVVGQVVRLEHERKCGLRDVVAVHMVELCDARLFGGAQPSTHRGRKGVSRTNLATGEVRVEDENVRSGDRFLGQPIRVGYEAAGAAQRERFPGYPRVEAGTARRAPRSGCGQRATGRRPRERRPSQKTASRSGRYSRGRILPKHLACPRSQPMAMRFLRRGIRSAQLPVKEAKTGSRTPVP